MLQRRHESFGSVGSTWSRVIIEPASYRNILYLMLGLPLGTLYFTVIVTGLSVSAGIMVVALLGIPLLIAMWYVNRAFMQIERGLAAGLLGQQIGPVPPVPAWPGGIWRHFKMVIADRYGWKGMLYLLLRFPVGIFTFTVAVTLVSTSLGLTFAPAYMWAGEQDNWMGGWFDPYPWSFALVPLGIILTFVSLHLMNALAKLCGRWAAWALG